MATLPEQSQFDDVYQIEVTDPVQGGVNGITNIPLKQLVNRTRYLKDELEAASTTVLALNATVGDHENRIESIETNDIPDLTAAVAALNTYANNLRETIGASTGVRHGIVAAKHGTGSNTGKPSFLDTSTVGTTSGSIIIQASATEPFIASMAAGFNSFGPVDRYGIATANTTINYSGSTDKILLASISASGVITFSLDDFYPVFASYAAPETPSNGVWWFNLSEEKMYKRESGAWGGRDRIIIAIISPGAGSITYYPTIRRGAKELFGVTTVPSGTVHTFAGTVANIPTGYLACSGGTVSRTTYSHLFQAIGTTYGAGDGSTTFGLPDLRAEFIRGLDNSRGIDAGRALGSAQADMFKAHNHVQRYTQGGGPDDGYTIDGSNDPSNQVTTSITTAQTGGTETRPRNIAMNFIIKF